jgi:hypothetical protein
VSYFTLRPGVQRRATDDRKAKRGDAPLFGITLPLPLAKFGTALCFGPPATVVSGYGHGSLVQAGHH